MLIRVASDLHLEFFRRVGIAELEEHFLPQDPRDAGAVLAMAGDISSDLLQLREFMERVVPRFALTLYVPGNHEYYGSEYETWNRAAREQLAGINKLWAAIGGVQGVEFDGVHFVFGTLWGDGGSTTAESQAIERTLHDFRAILIGSRKLQAFDMRRFYNAQRDSISFLLRQDAATRVVVTHHMPSYALSHPRFAPIITGGFAGDCDDLLRGRHAPALWIHGHTHDTIDRQLHDTRIVCNPAGYRQEWGTQFNQFFAAPKFVSVAA